MPGKVYGMYAGKDNLREKFEIRLHSLNTLKNIAVRCTSI